MQRVGMLTSDDLYHWERVPEPVLTAHPDFHEMLDLTMWHDQAWRDPWMHVDPSDGHVHVFVTARSNQGDRYDRGVIAHARSRDLLTWEMLPSITAPPGFGQLEVPQLVTLGDRWYMLFASDVDTQSEERRATGPGTGTDHLVADSPYGPFSMLGDGALKVDRLGTTYAGKVSHTSDGPVFMAWNRFEPDGRLCRSSDGAPSDRGERGRLFDDRRSGASMTAWTQDHLDLLRPGAVGQLAVIVDSDIVPVVEGIDIWDSWPIRNPDGSVADVCGQVVWIALAAPSVGDPGLRHDIARQRAFALNDDGTFTDLGLVFDVNNPLGARRWAGSTVLDGDRLSAYYTAVGIADAEPSGFRQRPAVATATLSCQHGHLRFDDWSDHVEVLQPDPRWYDNVDQIDGAPGFIKAFRDPFPFIDPATGTEYLFLTASLSPERSTSEFNGAIGIAHAPAAGSRIGNSSSRWSLPMASTTNSNVHTSWLSTAGITSSSPHRAERSTPTSTPRPVSTGSSPRTC